MTLQKPTTGLEKVIILQFCPGNFVERVLSRNSTDRFSSGSLFQDLKLCSHKQRNMFQRDTFTINVLEIALFSFGVRLKHVSRLVL